MERIGGFVQAMTGLGTAFLALSFLTNPLGLIATFKSVLIFFHKGLLGAFAALARHPLVLGAGIFMAGKYLPQMFPGLVNREETKIEEGLETSGDEEVYEQVNKADYVIAGTEKYDQELLSKLVNLKGISRVGIGIDNIDLDIAAKNNIKIFNTPEEPAKGVAELTLTFILNLLREISSHQHNLNQGNWERTLGKSLNEATISLIGGGRVAKNVSKFLLSAGVKKIKVFDILDLSTDPDWSHESISICGFEECLSNSDIVSLHVPMNEENKNMISKKELLVMGKNSYLINVSRGGLITRKIYTKL